MTKRLQPRRSPRKRRRSRPLRVEALENRRVLATFTVTTAADVVDENDSLISLREAVESANMSVGPDTITFDPATLGSRTEIDLLLGQLDISDGLTISGPGRHLLTIDAQGDSRVINFNSVSGSLALQGLTLTGGRTTETDMNSSGSGGGIRFASSGTLTLNQVTVAGNRTEGTDARGGGIFIEAGSVVLTRTTVSSNHTSGIGAKGGGIFAGTATVSLVNSNVSGNTTSQTGARGGGIYAAGGQVTLVQSTLFGNSTFGESASGGGVFSKAAVSLEASVVSGNTTIGDDSDGGGIFARGSLAVLRSRVSENSTSGRYSVGGAIITDAAAVIIRDSSVSGNQTGGRFAYGGAIFAGRSDVTILGSTLSGNAATGADSDGGGVSAIFTTVTVHSSTITQNSTTGTGGGVYFFDNQDKTLRIENSIVAGNSDSGVAPDFLTPQIAGALTVRSSLIGDNSGTTLGESQTADLDGNLVGDPLGSGVIDPMLGQLTLIGTTKVHPLLAGSPAINAGDNAIAVSTLSDQRGAPFDRIADSIVDIGSFERQTIDPALLVVTTPMDEQDFGNVEVSLREAIAVANGSLGADQIRFDPTDFSGSTNIDLLLGELRITDSLSIDGPGSDKLSVDALGSSRVINVAGASADLMMTGLTVTGGLTTAAGASGAGIRFDSSGTLTLEDTKVIDNHTGGDRAAGGGIYSSGGLVIADHSVVAMNSTTGNDAAGGGIYAGGGLVITESTIAGNTTRGARASGGGVYADRSGGNAVEMSRSTVSDNATNGTSAHGGGIAIGEGAVVVINSTLSQNTASGDGGSVFVESSAADQHRFVSATVAANTSGGVGGGLNLGADGNGAVDIHNSIVATNIDAGTAPDLDLSRLAGTRSIESTLIGDNRGTTLDESQTPDVLGNLIGAPNPGGGVIDPMLGPLASRGGVTPSHSLLPGSPAIDRGDLLLLGQLDTDQRGQLFVRASGRGPDMGSFEVQTLDPSFFMVTTVVDELDLSNSDISLREALELAAGSEGLETIRFDPGVFSQSRSIDLVHGEFQITDSVDIVGPGRDLLTIDAQNNSRIIHVSSGSPDVVVDGLSLTGGQTEDGGGAIRFGAAGSLTIRSASVLGNSAQRDGGGIFIREGSLLLHDTIVSGNQTDGFRAGGGAIRMVGGTHQIIDSTISSNSTLGAHSSGGAILAGPHSLDQLPDVTIIRSTISDSLVVNGEHGGGIHVERGDLTIEQSVVSGNRTDGAGSEGGGIFLREGTLVIIESRIESNESGGDGGGILVTGGQFELTDSSVTGNRVTGVGARGGGISMNDVRTRITGSTVSGNAASGVGGFGGGISSEAEVALDIINSTITANTSTDRAGGVGFFGQSGQGTPMLNNSIVAANTDSGIAPDLLERAAGPTPSVRSSLIGDNAGNSLAEAATPDASGSLVGSSAGGGVIDPLLAPLSNNGGTTLTHAPMAGSAAIDGGDDALAVDENSDPLSYDQRGAPFSRFFGSVDIGSVEMQPPREPVIDWPDPDNIFVGTALTSIQLNAATNTSGTFFYSPDIGTILDQGDAQTLMVAFTPDDLVNYAPVTATALINVVEQSDLGDAPDSYATRRSDDGPRHLVGSLTLGSSVDAEVDGTPSDQADADGADDDGVAFLTSLVADSLTPTTATINVRTSARSKLDAWIDFDANGLFDHPSEHLGGGTSIELAKGNNLVAITIPAGAIPGETFARFRLSSDGSLLPTGAAADGEVEDYAARILDGSSASLIDLRLPRGFATLLADQGQLVVRRLAEDFFRAPASAVDRYEILGDEFSNVLTIDNSGGDAIPTGGLFFDGVDRVNTVRLAGAHDSLDLSRDGNVSLRNIDVLDMTAPGSTTLTLDARAVRAMDSIGSGIIVVGDPDDSIAFADGAQWRMAEPMGVAGFSFSVVTLADTFVQIDFVSPWQNLAQPSDVNNDGNVTAGDALRIINELARRAFSDPDTFLLDDAFNVSPWPGIYFDQNGDGSATALDALRVINELARRANGSGEGESEQQSRVSHRDSSHLAPPRCSPTECAPRSIGSDRSNGFASAVFGSTSAKSTLRSHSVGRDDFQSGFVTAERDGYFAETTRNDESRLDAAAIDQLLADSSLIDGMLSACCFTNSRA